MSARLVLPQVAIGIVSVCGFLAPQFALADSQSYTTPGAYSFAVPSYGTLTVQVWGGGGGASCGAAGPFGNIGAAQAAPSGGNSSFASVIGGGGTGSGGVEPGYPYGYAYGPGGSASGGDTNIPGGNGSNEAYYGGNGYGGSSPNGGSGGASGIYPNQGQPGTAPGGGGGGGSGNGTFNGGEHPICPGGGAGGYAKKTYSQGDLAPGSSVPVVVGAGGAGGPPISGYGIAPPGASASGAGAPGEVSITWTAAGPQSACQQAPLLCVQTPASNPSDDSQCSAGFTLIGNSCILSCPSGQLYQNGMCVASCDVGYIEENGVECAFNSCPTDYTQESDQSGNTECVLTSCPTGYELENDSCAYTGQGLQNAGGVPVPTIASWQVKPILLQKGESASIAWSAQNVASCAITGTNGDSWTGGSGATTSSPIESQTTYTITCKGETGSSPASVTQSTTVNLVPTYVEQ